MTRRRYAESTTVPIGQSRGEIDTLLREWGCTAIQWTDEIEAGWVRLGFRWRPNGEAIEYHARFVLSIASRDALKSEARHASTGAFLPRKWEKLCAGIGRREHRALLLWLKATFVAIEQEIVDAESVFLPWLVGSDGRTVAEAALPRLRVMLEAGGAANLLEAGR